MGAVNNLPFSLTGFKGWLFGIQFRVLFLKCLVMNNLSKSIEYKHNIIRGMKFFQFQY